MLYAGLQVIIIINQFDCSLASTSCFLSSLHFSHLIIMFLNYRQLLQQRHIIENYSQFIYFCGKDCEVVTWSADQSQSQNALVLLLTNSYKDSDLWSCYLRMGKKQKRLQGLFIMEIMFGSTIVFRVILSWSPRYSFVFESVLYSRT